VTTTVPIGRSAVRSGSPGLEKPGSDCLTAAGGCHYRHRESAEHSFLRASG